VAQIHGPVKGLLEKDETVLSHLADESGINAVDEDHADHDSHRFCIHDALIVVGYFKELRRIRAYPTEPNTAIGDVISNLHAFQGSTVELTRDFGLLLSPKCTNDSCDVGGCSCSCGCDTCHVDFDFSIDQISTTALRKCAGLCLDCILEEQPSAVQCRIGHDAFAVSQIWESEISPA